VRTAGLWSRGAAALCGRWCAPRGRRSTSGAAETEPLQSSEESDGKSHSLYEEGTRSASHETFNTNRLAWVPNPLFELKLKLTTLGVLESLAPICINTPVLKFQVPSETLISCFRCVWLGLELNSAGTPASRTEFGDPCSTTVLYYTCYESRDVSRASCSNSVLDLWIPCFAICSVCVSVCVCVCLSVCLSVCVSLSVCLCVCVCVSVCVCLSVCLSVCVCLFVCLSVCMCVCVCVLECVSLCVCECVCVCVCICVLECVSVCVCVCVCVSVCVCVCVFVC